MIRYWLTPKPDERCDEKIGDICEVYRAAPELAAVGERVISTDEMTGVQALERAAQGLPLAPGKIERREFEYIRHGTLTFTINFDVVTGKVIVPSWGPTRTEADFVARKLLKRGSFQSVDDLRTKVLAFIEYYNATMAKPFKWTYKGKALAI